MKISILYNVVLSSLTIFSSVNAQGSGQKCSRLVERKEIRDLSPQEWSQIRSVLNKLQQDGTFERITTLHTEQFPIGHNCATLFPLHRQIVRDFEKAGQVYDSNFFVPYWDAARDFQDPANSGIFNNNLIGGNGNPMSDNCVTDGLQSKWSMAYTTPHCLRRVFNGGNNSIKPWYSPEYISSILQTSADYEKFREAMEFTIHGAVHLGFGGEMITMQSSNDIGFYLHHANLDRLWWKWQNSNPNNLMSYGGNNLANNSPAKLDDKLPGYNQNAKNVMILGYNDMCFNYGDVVPLESLRSDNPALSNFRSSGASSSQVLKSGTIPNFRLSTISNKLRTLNNSTLEKFFPAIKNGEINPNLFDFNFGSTVANLKNLKRSSQKKEKKKLPLPEMPPDSFIKMHNYNKNRVKSVVGRATEFAKKLNEEGYESPFW
ncbi:hypothetical protein BB561_000670 [Smittium simulii]|uniref:Tyrosinase copper-binding domain-containing protein n=1 Tax=Smittium simulii TaxID=133385 RepID=A0A2T9YY23_9FUNG|nr:hypothetical protein BB561_000670 [Smittium simulii]